MTDMLNRPADVKTIKQRISNPATAIDSCEFIVHYMLRLMLHNYRLRWGKLPRLLYLPRSIEAAVEVDLARSDDQHVKLRVKGVAQEIFGCPVIWDADELKLES